MNDRSLTRRYVAAIHQLAVTAGEVEPVRTQLGRLQAAVTADPRLLQVLRHPEVSVAEKGELLTRLAGPETCALVAGLIQVLLEKERVEVLLGARDCFTELEDEAAGVVRAYVAVASEPAAEQQQRLAAALARLLGMPVVTEFHLDPAVIGGARVRVAGRVIDGSLGGQSDRLAEHLRAAHA